MAKACVAHKRRALILSQLAIAAAGCSVARATDYSSLLGVANIDASYYLTSNQDIMNEAQNQIIGVGSSSEKLELDQYDLQNSWSVNSKYAWNTTWPTLNSSTTLTSLAQLPAFEKALSSPGISNYVLTTYSPNIPGGGDGTEYWLNGMTLQQEQAETTSFYNLTKYLMQTYAGTGKSFYLENWEGDWALRDPGRNTVPSQTAVNGMIDWVNARQAGIDEARSQFASQDPNVHVYGTLEVNLVQDAMEGDAGGYDTVTNDVLPHTTVDFASYSSYDTQQNTTGPYSYANAVNYIAQHLPATAINGQNTHSVYVGEFGLAEDSAGSAAVNATMNNVINTAVADGMPMALYWEMYSNELSNGVTTAPGGSGNNSAVKGFYFIKPDGTPATAWNTYRYLLTVNNPALASTSNIERSLHLAYASNFTVPGVTLGSAWTTSTYGGAMNVGIANSQLQMTTVNGSSVPYGLATLNIDSVLGQGLQVGEYLQFTLNRLNDVGIIGLSAFGLNHGSAIGSGNQTFQVYPNVSGDGWTPVAYNGSNNTNPTYNWDAPTTLGLQLTSADGHFATISYYVNGTYSGSWLYNTSSTSLDTFSLLAQSNTSNSVFSFNNLAIYTTKGALAGTNFNWDPAHNGSGSGGSGNWDFGTTSNIYNGSADVTWNYATQADQLSFGGTAGTVTVSSAGVAASTLVFNTPGYVLSGGTITMMGNQTINASSGAVTIDSAIAGNSGLTVTGSGSVILSSQNTFTGGLFVTGGGTASFSVDANLGAAGQPITLDHGTLSYTNSNSPTLSRPITINEGGGTLNTVNSAGAGKLIVTGLISGSGTMTKIGPGWLTIYSSNTNTGGWAINGGVVEAGAANALGSGNITINSGGELSENSTSAISNPLTLNSGATISADFTASGTGSYSGNIVVNGPFSVRLGNFWSNVSQSVSLSGNMTGAGTLTTLTPAGAVSTTGTLTVSGNNSGYSGNLNITAGSLVAALSSNNVLGTGQITLSNSKLLLQGQLSSSGGADAGYQSYSNNLNVTASASIDVTGSLKAYLGNLTVNSSTLTVSSADTTGAPYSLNVESTTASGNPTFNVQSSTGGGRGTLVLNDGLSSPPNQNTTAGQLSAVVYSSLSIVSGTVQVAPQSVKLPATTIVTSALNLSGNGTLDLANNNLIVRNGNLATISDELTTGYGSAGGWYGSGITSSAAAADSMHLTALGVMLNTTNGSAPVYTTFEGQPAGAADVLVKYTWYGDADLSGTVDGSDYSRIDNGFLNHLTGWQNGDFNYDGVIDGSDYTLIDNTFNRQGASFFAAIASPTAVVAVPEPAMIFPSAVVFTGLVASRRCRWNRG
jgi:hypothetical protein